MQSLCLVLIPIACHHYSPSWTSAQPTDTWMLDAPSKETREASGNVGCIPSVHTPKKSNQSSDSPVLSKPSGDSTNLREAWGYVHRWWRAGRTFHLPFGSCHLTEKTNFPPVKGWCNHFVQRKLQPEVWEEFGQEPNVWVLCWWIGNLNSFRQAIVNPLQVQGKRVRAHSASEYYCFPSFTPQTLICFLLAWSQDGIV